MRPRNVDPAELSKFDTVAHRWWDPTSDFKPLHDINPLRVGYIDERAGLAGKRVLDVGCGGGLLSEAMDNRGAAVTGIDAGALAVEVARLHQLESGSSVDYRHVDAAELLEQEPDGFDIVTCLELLEHVPDPSELVEACTRLTRPGGDLFFSTLNRNPRSWLLAVVGAEYLLRLLPRGTHDYRKLIRPSELAAWGRQAGLELQQLIGVQYDPFRGRASLVDSLAVNYVAWFKRPDTAL